MSKSIIAAAALATLLIAAPAFAQDSSAGCPADSESRSGSGVLRQEPEQPAAGHVKVFDGRDATLRTAPEEPSTRRRATLYVRKAGDDRRSDAQPSGGTGLRKAGTGTLVLSSGAAVPAARVRTSNNMKQVGLASSCR